MDASVFQTILAAKVGPLPLLLVMALLMFGLPAVAVGFAMLRYNKKNKDK